MLKNKLQKMADLKGTDSEGLLARALFLTIQERYPEHTRHD